MGLRRSNLLQGKRGMEPRIPVFVVQRAGKGRDCRAGRIAKLTKCNNRVSSNEFDPVGYKIGERNNGSAIRSADSPNSFCSVSAMQMAVIRST